MQHLTASAAGVDGKSNASLTATLRGAFSDEVDPLEVGPECSRRWAEALRRALVSRERFRL